MQKAVLSLLLLPVAIASCTPNPEAQEPETITISGGAWLERNDGTSEPIRGAKIYFCSIIPIAKEGIEPSPELPVGMDINHLDRRIASVCPLTTSTGVDGKYEIKLPGDYYQVYASMNTEALDAYWWLEGDLYSRDASLDFTTRTATRIGSSPGF